ncbi:MAG: hypothetical protein GWM90_17450, partial [Gemmatimonadetes bacterium]|nr:hypothetical protein [Gemmatimonadota bacterium]NIQ56126.1 hypothetical protein [Gemmatimonadota bacterium]NIU76310.1 hypothetical protein [Gammaproteobacteria bacterium]NIX45812.1 hypothetical protein [Gemmatimonadota bacterium]
MRLQPNGDGIVFWDTADAGSYNFRLWFKAGDQADAAPLPNTGNALFPAFSPDGQWLAYISMDDNQLR